MFDTKEIFETQHEEEDEDVEEVKAAAVVEPNQELLTSLKVSSKHLIPIFLIYNKLTVYMHCCRGNWL